MDRTGTELNPDGATPIGPLSVAWFGFRHCTPSNYFETAAGLGVRFVEIPLYWHIIEDRDYDYSADGIRRLLEMAERAQVRIVASVSALDLAGTWDTRGRQIDQSTTTFARAAARRVIDVAASLGIEVVRLTEPNIPAARQREAMAYMRSYGRVLRGLGDYAGDRGLRIVAENYGVSGEQIRALLDAADHPAVGTLYDPCNYFRLGEDPVAALRLLRGKVFYCQLKDALRADPRAPDLLFPGSRWPPSVAVGEGDIDWTDVLSELATSYDGYLAVEYEIAEDVVRGTRVSLANLRQLISAAGTKPAAPPTLE